jgi:hypothetical protein
MSCDPLFCVVFYAACHLEAENNLLRIQQHHVTLCYRYLRSTFHYSAHSNEDNNKEMCSLRQTFVLVEGNTALARWNMGLLVLAKTQQRLLMATTHQYVVCRLKASAATWAFKLWLLFIVESLQLSKTHTCNFICMCGLVVRVPDCYHRGPVFDSRRYHIFWVAVCLERGPLSSCEDKLWATWKKSSGSGLENWD